MTDTTSEVVARLEQIGAAAADRDYHRSIMAVYGDLPRGQLYIDAASVAALISSLVAERDTWRQHCSKAEEMWTQYQDGLYAENGRRHKAEDKVVECHEMICALGARALTAERLLAEARAILSDFVTNYADMQDGDGNEAPELARARAALEAQP